MVKFIFGLILGLAILDSSLGQDCWWTGCQPRTWAVVGCGQYGRQENGRQSCAGGFKYNCCVISGGSGAGVGAGGSSGGGSSGGEQGMCSWYGAPNEIPQGWPTACGQKFDRFAMKAAHKTLPCGTKIRVRNIQTGRTVDVTINDRGPFTSGRIVDLSYAAFGQVENRDKGLFRCDYKIIK